MIFFAVPIMFYVFWKKMFDECGIPFMAPFASLPLDYMVMCAKR